MGHLHASNISKVVNHMLHKGDMTIKGCIAELARTKTKVRASEGAYGADREDYREMLGCGVDQILHVLYEGRLIQPVRLTRAQKKVFDEWVEGDVFDWSADEGGESPIFDSIKWRPLKKRLPVIQEIES